MSIHEDLKRKFRQQFIPPYRLLDSGYVFLCDLARELGIAQVVLAKIIHSKNLPIKRVCVTYQIFMYSLFVRQETSEMGGATTVFDSIDQRSVEIIKQHLATDARKKYIVTQDAHFNTSTWEATVKAVFYYNADVYLLHAANYCSKNDAEKVVRESTKASFEVWPFEAYWETMHSESREVDLPRVSQKAWKWKQTLLAIYNFNKSLLANDGELLTKAALQKKYWMLRGAVLLVKFLRCIGARCPRGLKKVQGGLAQSNKIPFSIFFKTYGFWDFSGGFLWLRMEPYYKKEMSYGSSKFF